MTTIKQRRGTAAQWASANPVLAAGEPGFETDTGNHKIGDGTTAWNSLKATNSATYVAQTAGFLPGIPGYNLRPVNFPKWRAAVAKARAGDGQAKLLVVGDSTSMGVGTASDAPNLSWPGQLTAALNRAVAPTVKGLAIPFTAISDARWSAGSGWTYDAGAANLGWGDLAAFQANSGAAGSVTFAPDIAVDTFDIYYARSSGLGSVNASVDGGGATAINANGAALLAKATVTVTAGTGHVLTITGPTGGGFYLLGIDAYLSTASVIRVGNAGVGSSTTAGWAGSGTWQGQACIQAWAPDLTIIMLGVNDSGTGVTDATWLTNTTAIAAAAAVSGDVLLVSVVPSQDAGKAALEAQYQASALSLANADGYGFVDVLARLGSYTADNAAGYAYDADHLNEKGYAEVAAAVTAALTAIIGNGVGGPPTPTWTAATLGNSWVNYGAPFAPAGYRKDQATGIVWLQGLIKSGTTTQGTALFTLPAGMRPAHTLAFTVPSADAFGEIRIASTGVVEIDAGTNAWLSLNGVAFLAEG